MVKAWLVAFLLSTGPAVAVGPFDDGQAAYDRGDYATALQLWRPLADQGDASAQSSLGAMYAFGKGVQRDDAVAVTWFRKAAEQGHAGPSTTSGSCTITARECRETIRRR